MDYVRLGATGLRVSKVCLGMMTFGDPSWRDRSWIMPESEAEPFVRRAADAGITFFDTADVYSFGLSEEITGRMLRKVFARREEYVVATKVRNIVGDAPNDFGLSRGHIMDSVDNSLRRLGTDHIDLYQIHRWHRKTPIEETMEALHDCVKAGKVRYIGASSMWAWQFAKAQRVAEVNGRTRFVAMQPHYNLLYREEEREMLPQCRDMGVGIIPWSPLARGHLARPSDQRAATGRGGNDPYADELYADANTAIIDAVGEIAEARGVSRAQVALAWLMSRPGLTAPIVGATKLSHIDDAVAAVDIDLDEDEVARLEQPYRSREVVGHY
jgi:1-deoxyxylulose-5-phosphate synthase